jgi:hypothetical protein
MENKYTMALKRYLLTKLPAGGTCGMYAVLPCSCVIASNSDGRCEGHFEKSVETVLEEGNNRFVSRNLAANYAEYFDLCHASHAVVTKNRLRCCPSSER